ncbi:hypothetical protein [Pelagibius sp. 7325]|uniref:hypothetical protein n=1 Tax=Pelagibius sp. 7325 TaxID=3131994 RepID=UPI0030ED0FDD
MPSDLVVLQYLPYVLPLALPALWLLRCLISTLLGRRPNGGCSLCFVLTAAGFTFWPEVAPLFGIDGALRTFSLPDDIGLRLLIIGFFLLAVGFLLYFIPWLVRRLERGSGRARYAADDAWVGHPGRGEGGWEEVLEDACDFGLDGADAGDGGS